MDSGEGVLPSRNSIMRASLGLLCVEVSFGLALLRVSPHTGPGILWHTDSVPAWSYISDLQQRDFQYGADGSEMQHREQFTLLLLSALWYKDSRDLLLYSRVV